MDKIYDVGDVISYYEHDKAKTFKIKKVLIIGGDAVNYEVIFSDGNEKIVTKEFIEHIMDNKDGYIIKGKRSKLSEGDRAVIISRKKDINGSSLYGEKVKIVKISSIGNVLIRRNVTNIFIKEVTVTMDDLVSLPEWNKIERGSKIKKRTLWIKGFLVIGSKFGREYIPSFDLMEKYGLEDSDFCIRIDGEDFWKGNTDLYNYDEWIGLFALEDGNYDKELKNICRGIITNINSGRFDVVIENDLLELIKRKAGL